MGENQISAEKVKADITGYQFVPISEEISQGQVIIEKKLLFDGTIDINLNINCSKKRNKIYEVNRKFYFNHYMNIPVDQCDETIGKLICFTEDVTYSQINRRKMLVSITLLVEYQN